MMSDKKDKSLIEIVIDVVVDSVNKDIQTVLELLPDDIESEGDDDE